MENETTFTVEEVREALTEALKEDFLSNTNAFEQNTLGEQHEEIFRRDHESEIFNQIVEESVERFLENDSKIDTDLETFVANEIANADYDTNEVLNEYLVDTVDWTINTNDQDWIDSFSNGEDIREGSLDYQFTNDFVIIEDKSSFDGEVYDRQEGIEKALENGFDLDKLIEVTSESEVLEAARNVSDFEVIDAYELQNAATDKVVELLIEDAKEFGVEINTENLNSIISEVMNDNYSSTDSSITDTINDLALDKVIAIDDSSNPEVIMTNDMTKEELIQEIADSIYADHKETIQEQVNDGVTFEEAAELGKSEIAVEGDHASIKEDTMAGVESERVVDRETALNELDKAPGVDSGKVETQEESAQRDNLTVAEKENKLVEVAETTNDPKVLDRLADTDSERVQEAVAKNENTSEATLDKLSESSHESVKEAVVANENSSEKAVEKASEKEQSQGLSH